MLTLPTIVERPIRYYVAVRRDVVLPFDDEIPPIMDTLFTAAREQGIDTSGLVAFKHDVIDMPRIGMSFALIVPDAVAAADPLVSGMLPAGRYAEVIYTGPYDDLMEVNTVLIGWARQKGLAWDMEAREDGEHFVARAEIYHNGPDDEPDPQKWRTTLAIKLRE